MFEEFSLRDFAKRAEHKNFMRNAKIKRKKFQTYHFLIVQLVINPFLNQLQIYKRLNSAKMTSNDASEFEIPSKLYPNFG